MTPGSVHSQLHAMHGNLLCAREWRRDGISLRSCSQSAMGAVSGSTSTMPSNAERAGSSSDDSCVRHNDVTRELQRISEMNWPGTVLEPVIHHGDPGPHRPIEQPRGRWAERGHTAWSGGGCTHHRLTPSHTGYIPRRALSQNQR